MQTRPLPASRPLRGHRAAISRAALLRAAAPLALAAIAAISSACSSTVDRRADAWGGEGAHAATAARKPVASQGGSWELVFPSPGVAARLADSGDGPEYARLDGSLNPRTNQPLTAIDSWPEAPRADLSRARSVRVRDNQNAFIYYFPTNSRRGGTSGGGGGTSTWWY